jgi:NitT/TauT family transport system substrate-binding protein
MYTEQNRYGAQHTGLIMARLQLVAAAVVAFLAGATPNLRADAAEIVVTLYGTGMYGVAYAVGLEKGYFKEAGIDLTSIAGGTGGGNVLRNVLASELPFGEVAISAIIAAQKQGLPIVVVGAGARAFDNAWLVPPTSKIATIQDMVGKRVSYTNPKSISEAFIMMLLKNNGIDPAKVTRVSAGSYGAGLTLLGNGGVDVAPLTEPLRTQVRAKYREIFTAKDALPPITATGLVTTRDYARKNPDKVRALLEGRRRGVDFVYANPVEAGKIMAKHYRMAEEVTVEATTRMAKEQQWLAGEIILAEYENLAEGMRLTGEISGPVDWPTLIDLSHLPADLKAKSKVELRQ